MRRYRKKPKIDHNKPEMKFVKSLGKGTYGSVDLFSYTKHDGSTLYNAVKISDSKHHNSIDRELKVLSKLRGRPGIVQPCGNSLLQETDSNGEKVYKMAIEYAAGGNLTDFIRVNRRLSDPVIKDFTRMILQGLVSVHEHGYVHCDLKPENLLLFPRHDQDARFYSYEIKISDFGLTIKAGEESVCWETKSPFVGTPLYMSPESVRDGSAVEKPLDLWSLGCIVLEMCVGKHPWLGSSVDDVKSRLLCGKAPEIPETVACDAREFVEKCFARKAEERGSASELLLHPFLNGERKVDGGGGGVRRRVGLRVRKPPSRFEDIAKKIFSSKSSKFKRVSNKPLKMKILPARPLRSNFVPIQ
ncbi:Protein kinase superfamily protein [Raphanus sativus]|uniref:Mitogen-activated protein kinase kinase kinase 20-like n=1 Tax=Raphanus sativus TaxID=3726 RepID=A0A6J0M602_RAPSA|nr:mitogen-activated protein kinase kinase kinase 20-like [Raphanus sativus]KAJ4904072.1 Protein kinase superfamily protein [Raphanus sativus]